MTTMLEKMAKRLEDRKPQRDNSIYAVWGLKTGGSTVIRFLPYNDPITGAFWAERVLLNMSFGDPLDDSKVVTFKAPCREMYVPEEKCPILGPVRALYDQEKELRNAGSTKDADYLKKVAGAHWKKPTYYYQGFVVKSGFVEDALPENPIRVFPLNKELHQTIYASIFEREEDPFLSLPTGEFTMDDIAAIMDDTADDSVLEKLDGFNFIVKKGKRGDYAEYVKGSSWATNNVATLDEEQVIALHTHGMHDLQKRLPDRPSEEAYEVLTEMMEVSIKRMLDDDNGVWRKEWEEFGFKPFRPKDKNAASGDSGGTEAAAADKPATTTTTTGGLSKLKKARGAQPAEAAEAASEESAAVTEVVKDDELTAEVEEKSPKVASPLSERIRKRVATTASA